MTSLADALDSAWTLLVRGGADRRSPMHTPVVSSIAANGLPDSRVMVLRKAERVSACLRFHTDARSPKAQALAGAPVSILAYDSGAAIQLRLSGSARVRTDGPDIDAIWHASTPFARRCYMVGNAPGSVLDAPGSGLPADVEGRSPTAGELLLARANFAVVMIAVTGIDWLHLAASGHRRARFCAADGWQGCWLAP
ncbi:pyridoxamine 5'-phosphate oxidase family protein [Sandarakinorhabdus sp.]|uniref:pyridoxamine 5'-phosphate oxidase family protein n=1 Tax=Sandarakinorhabdus sp. TaxID=1916663 RepID=UPI00286EA099|nr:pyridoxamine 5'-phosphate oxidase family protein [Sandarakinorhabdus sp.]